MADEHPKDETPNDFIIRRLDDIANKVDALNSDMRQAIADLRCGRLGGETTSNNVMSTGGGAGAIAQGAGSGTSKIHLMADYGIALGARKRNVDANGHRPEEVKRIEEVEGDHSPEEDQHAAADDRADEDQQGEETHRPEPDQRLEADHRPERSQIHRLDVTSPGKLIYISDAAFAELSRNLRGGVFFLFDWAASQPVELERLRMISLAHAVDATAKVLGVNLGRMGPWLETVLEGAEVKLDGFDGERERVDGNGREEEEEEEEKAEREEVKRQRKENKKAKKAEKKLEKAKQKEGQGEKQKQEHDEERVKEAQRCIKWMMEQRQRELYEENLEAREKAGEVSDEVKESRRKMEELERMENERRRERQMEIEKEVWGSEEAEEQQGANQGKKKGKGKEKK